MPVNDAATAGWCVRDPPLAVPVRDREIRMVEDPDGAAHPGMNRAGEAAGRRTRRQGNRGVDTTVRGKQDTEIIRLAALVPHGVRDRRAVYEAKRVPSAGGDGARVE